MFSLHPFLWRLLCSLLVTGVMCSSLGSGAGWPGWPCALGLRSGCSGARAGLRAMAAGLCGPAREAPSAHGPSPTGLVSPRHSRCLWEAAAGLFLLVWCWVRWAEGPTVFLQTFSGQNSSCLFFACLFWGGDFASAENLERIAACLMGRSQAVPETQAVQKPLSTQGFTDCDLTILRSASQGASQEQLMRDFLACVERSSRI